MRRKHISTLLVESIVSKLRAAQDEKWSRARVMIKTGHSPKRIAELIDLPASSIRIVKIAGDW